MKTNRTTLAALLALSLCTATAAHALKVGESAPPFTLTDTHGVEHRLSDYAGKVVVLEWLNHDCPFVKKHYDSGNMPELQKGYTAKGVVWLSINSSAPGKQGNYPPEKANELTQQKGGAATAVLLDPDGTVGRAYGAKTTPHMYVIDQKGVLRYAGAIDSIPSTDRADISRATSYVAAALDAVLAGKEVETKATQAYGCSVKY